MKLIYVAGKYSAPTPEGIKKNIAKAEKASVELLKNKWAVITPHKNTSGYEYYEDYIEYTHSDWLAMDFVMLDRCDAIFMLKGWQDSKGAVEEYDRARALDLEIFFEEDGYPIEKES
jgi:hypothetical protein